MDWNTFFSSIAQTSAALLGVVLAFIISRILNESSDFDCIDKETNDIMVLIRELKIRIGELNIQGHDEMILEYDSNIDELFRRRVLIGLTDEEIEKCIRDNIPRIYAPQNIMSLIKERIEKEEMKQKEISRRPDAIFPMVDRIIPKLIPDGLWRNISNFESTFRDYEIRTAVVINKARNQKKAIERNIKDFDILKKVTIAFLPIIIITIVYPLHFLPMSEGQIPAISFDIINALGSIFSISGFFISSILFIAIGIVIYFSKICKDHIDKYNELLALFGDEILNIKKYSELFEIQEI